MYVRFEFFDFVWVGVDVVVEIGCVVFDDMEVEGVEDYG